MPQNKSTSNIEYTERLNRLETKKWKDLLDVQRPYRINIHKLHPGKTLDIGCGIGRNLKHLPKGSVGVDHNSHSISHVNKMGLTAYIPKDFIKSKYAQKEYFDSMLLAHVIEHMDKKSAIKIVKEYLPFVKNGGKVIIICPQKRGYSSDSTHVTFYNLDDMSKIMTSLGLRITKKQSFPFPEKIGDYFTHNEYVVVGNKD